MAPYKTRILDLGSTGFSVDRGGHPQRLCWVQREQSGTGTETARDFEGQERAWKRMGENGHFGLGEYCGIAAEANEGAEGYSHFWQDYLRRLGVPTPLLGLIAYWGYTCLVRVHLGCQSTYTTFIGCISQRSQVDFDHDWKAFLGRGKRRLLQHI